VVHFGPEPWGESSKVIDDVQVRVYDMGVSAGELKARISNAPARGSRFRREFSSGYEWQRARISYTKGFFDYEATGSVLIYFRSIDARTIAVVFMSTDGDAVENQARSIMSTVRCP
jgi:hypothetical protein